MLKAASLTLTTRPEPRPGGIETRLQFLLPELETATVETDLNSLDLLVVTIASGGCENQVKKLTDRFPEDTIFVVDGVDNSLAAGLESMTFLQTCRDYKRRLFYLDDNDTHDGQVLKHYLSARKHWHGGRIGLIGGVSDWLIASGFDEDAIRRKLGMEPIRITRQALLEQTGDALNGVEGIENRCQAISNYLLQLEKQLGLSAWTIRCFDLIPGHEITGCLAVSDANDRGITAGCEGDVPGLLSMMIASGFTGEPVFMANPSRMHQERRELTVAHCTLPTRMSSNVERMTHFESGQGVSLSGTLGDDHYGLYRVDGRLQEHIFLSGERIETPRRDDLCRTQLTVKTNPSPRELLVKPLGNHLAVFPLAPSKVDIFQDYASLFIR